MGAKCSTCAGEERNAIILETFFSPEQQTPESDHDQRVLFTVPPTPRGPPHNSSRAVSMDATSSAMSDRTRCRSSAFAGLSTARAGALLAFALAVLILAPYCVASCLSAFRTSPHSPGGRDHPAQGFSTMRASEDSEHKALWARQRRTGAGELEPAVRAARSNATLQGGSIPGQLQHELQKHQREFDPLESPGQPQGGPTSDSYDEVSFG